MQQSAVNFKNFMGSRAFTVVRGNQPSRTKLPFLRPPNETVPIWSLISKFVGQDLTKISLPVILSEPLSTNQRVCECVNLDEQMIAETAQEPNSLRRLAKTIVHNLIQYNLTKSRTKKPFNPMLGETYELVTEDFRWISEQVSHHPPITAYYQEGRGYKINGFADTKSSFGFGGGKGLMEVVSFGY